MPTTKRLTLMAEAVRRRYHDAYVPTPEQVHDLLHANFVADGYTNDLIRTALDVLFLTGVRSGEAASALRRQLSAERHELAITHATSPGRTLPLGAEICCGTQHPSIGSFLAKWHPEQDPMGPLLPRGNGQAFPNHQTFAAFIHRAANPILPGYTPYTARQWSVTARFIDWDFDIKRVAEWHGLEAAAVRARFMPRARQLHGKYGHDWIKRAFDGPHGT